MKTFPPVLAAAAKLSACSSIIEGTSQEIAVNTNPPGAMCRFEREGTVIATIPVTPAATTIKKTKHDITSLREGGTSDGDLHEHRMSPAPPSATSSSAAASAGRSIPHGADNKYTSPVNITLVPQAPRPALVRQDNAARRCR